MTKKPSRKVTQHEVARHAGVSQTTVSMVMNNSSLLTIPDETRQRVFDAIQELGYIPDRAARTLRTNKTCTIAAVIPDITNPFYPTFVRGIQDVTKQYAYDLMVYNTDGLLSEEHNCLYFVRQNNVDGLIIVPFHLSEDELININIHIPVVQLVQKPRTPPKLDSIYVDNAAATRLIVEHLIERGHVHIGMIAGAEDTPPQANRKLGYRAALSAHQLPLEENLIRHGNFTEGGGYEAMRELLLFKERFTAVFAANDLMALGAMMAIREAGLNIPSDVAVAGFDDIPAAKLVSPSLTTIRQFQDQIGQRAAEMIFDRLNRSAPEEPLSVEMPYSLIERQST